MLQKLAAILREQFTRQKFVHAFRGASGAIDLASIMVGVLVIGIIAGVVVATVLAVIPWSQDAAARGNLDAVRTAQSVARAQDGGYIDYQDLIASGYIHAFNKVDAVTDTDGTCYIAVAKSDSGSVFFSTSRGPTVSEYTEATPAEATSWCVSNVTLNAAIDGIGGLTGGSSPSANYGVVTTLAGSSTGGFADGTGAAAQFQYPHGVAVDSAGTVYVADTSSQRIRKITPAGVVTTLAGSGVAGFADGTGTAAQFYGPESVAVDSSGTVYVADRVNQRIRKITPAGVVTTLAGSGVAGYADGTGTAAEFINPQGVAVDPSGTVYVADTNNHRIRKITPAGVVTTLAGSGTYGFAEGTGGSAQFNYPNSVAVDSSGTVYVADLGNNRIRKITPAGAVTTLAGGGSGFADGTGSAAQFNNPSGVAVGSFGIVYVADGSNNRIRKITPAGVVTTLAGDGLTGFVDGTGIGARFNNPFGVAVNSSGTAYIADTYNQRIRKIQ